MSCSPVLVALRASSKGRLCYKSQVDSDISPGAKLDFLNQLTSPPPMSPEIVHVIEERLKRVSLSNHDHTPSPVPHLHTSTPHPSSALHESQDTPSHQTSKGYSLNLVDECEVEDPSNVTTSSLGISLTAVQGDSSGHVTESSLLDDMRQELDEELQSIDDRLMEQMNENIRHHREHLERELEAIRDQAAEQLAEMELSRKHEREQKELEKREMEELDEAEIKRKHEALKEEFKMQAEIMEAKLKSGEKQKMEILKNIERRAIEKAMAQRKELLTAASHTETRFTSLLQSCSHPQYLDKGLVDRVRVAIATLKRVQTQLLDEGQTVHPDQTKVSQCHAQLTGTHPTLADLKAAVEEAALRAEKEAKRQQSVLEEAARKLAEEKAAKEREAEQKKRDEEEKLKEATKQDAKKTTGDTSGLQIPKSMVEVYSSLHDKLSQTITTCASLTSTQDKELKRYRFDLQKAVTGTINSVSCHSGQDLIDKISHLKKLLSGQPVQVSTKTVSIMVHPDAKLYCFNLFAAKFVKQGEDQVASSTHTAFPLAALAVGIWSELQEVGHYLLAHFYSVCPVLVPMYVNQTKDMSDMEYMKSLGYNVSKEGVVENNDLFLNRVRGTVRLYAAIIQTPQLPTGRNPPPHPHGLEHGWAWLARMLNLEPHPTVTAAALADFLEIAGNSLMKKYGKQFQKLLLALWKEYVPKIEKVTPPADRGPLARLTQFLEGCIAAGKIPEPKGALNNEFWRTKSHGISVA